MDINELPPDDQQMALVMTAMVLTMVTALQELLPTGDDPLAVVQSKMAPVLTKLRNSPGFERPTNVFRYVREALRDPNIIPQPEP